MAKVIWLAEDDPNSSILTIHTLQKANVKNEIVVFRDGSDVLLGLENKDPLPLLILLDLSLHDIHGLDVLKYIRKHQNFEINSLCVFVLTVSDDQETIAKTIETGANAFLRKNLNMGDFLRAVQDCGIQLDIG